MNTLFYKYALEVERTGSITQAAENLFMAQPNLSKAIKEMEDTLGFTVFERTSKGVIPTQKGTLFLTYAQNIVVQLDKIDGIVANDNKHTQRFSICMPRGSYISKAITKLVAQLDTTKGMNLNIQETNSIQAINHLVEGKFNLGIIRYQQRYEHYFQNFIKEKGLQSEVIWEFENVALMSVKHPLATAKSIHYEDLTSSIEISHGDTMIPYIAAEKEEVPLQQKRIYLYERANQFELLAHIPETFMWVSPIPEEMLKRYELVQLQCDYTHNSYKDLLIYTKDYRFTTLDRKFIDLLYEAKNEVSFRNR